MIIESKINISEKIMRNKLRIMFVVGEISGDTHAAKLIDALREMSPQTEFEFFGATGKKMREAGVETIVRADDFARVGILEVAKSLPMFWKIFKICKKTAIARDPDAIILIDFPEFNLKLARFLKGHGKKVIYYVSPQVWAWRKYRFRGIRKNVDLLLTILPFEKDWYASKGFNKVKYVGNPLAGEVRSNSDRQEFCEKHSLDRSKTIIALLPGSRRTEIEKILPVLIETACLMFNKDQTLQFIIPLASTRKLSEVNKAFAQLNNRGLVMPKTLVTVKDETFDAINAADVAAVASGTATLETAILGTPLAIVYKISTISYHVLRHFISVEHIGLINLIAKEKLVKELIQNDFTATNLSTEIFRLLDDEENQLMRKRLAGIKEKLGEGGASTRAAQAILDELGLKATDL